MKYIKPKISDAMMIVYLQRLVISETNALLVSIPLHKLCKTFVRELKKIPLSKELQK